MRRETLVLTAPAHRDRYISHDDELGKHLRIMSCEADLSRAVCFLIKSQRMPISNFSPTAVTINSER